MDDELVEEDAPLTEAQRLEAERRLLEAHPERELEEARIWYEERRNEPGLDSLLTNGPE